MQTIVAVLWPLGAQMFAVMGSGWDLRLASAPSPDCQSAVRH
jgi:hypothetical protein